MLTLVTWSDPTRSSSLTQLAANLARPEVSAVIFFGPDQGLLRTDNGASLKFVTVAPQDLAKLTVDCSGLINPATLIDPFNPARPDLNAVLQYCLTNLRGQYCLIAANDLAIPDWAIAAASAEQGQTWISPDWVAIKRPGYILVRAPLKPNITWTLRWWRDDLLWREPDGIEANFQWDRKIQGWYQTFLDLAPGQGDWPVKLAGNGGSGWVVLDSSQSARLCRANLELNNCAVKILDTVPADLTVDLIKLATWSSLAGSTNCQAIIKATQPVLFVQGSNKVEDMATIPLRSFIFKHYQPIYFTATDYLLIPKTASPLQPLETIITPQGRLTLRNQQLFVPNQVTAVAELNCYGHRAVLSYHKGPGFLGYYQDGRFHWDNGVVWFLVSALPDLTRLNLVIGGACRNIAAHLPAVVANIKQLKSLFGHTTEIYVESLSQDNTVQLLKQSCPEATVVTLTHSSGSRTQRIAEARNEILRLARISQPDYLIMLDMDNVNTTPWNLDYFRICWAYSDWAAMTANSMQVYYDIWALRRCSDLEIPEDTKLGPTYDCWQEWFLLGGGNPVNPSGPNGLKCFQAKKFLNRNQALIPVDSAFGGLAIYRWDSIKPCCGYNGSKDGREVCEHVSFHDCMRSHGAKLYINPLLMVVDSA